MKQGAVPEAGTTYSLPHFENQGHLPQAGSKAGAPQLRLSDQGWVLKARPVGSQSRNLTAEGIKRLVCMKGPTAENVSKDFKRVFPSLEAEGLIEVGSASLSRLQEITCGCLDHF